MRQGTLTPREKVILRRLLGHKGITEYEIVGATSSGRSLPGILYEEEVESLQGYIVAVTTCYFFWLDFVWSSETKSSSGKYTLGEEGQFWQEIDPKTSAYFEQIVSAQYQLQQTRPALNVFFPALSYQAYYRAVYAPEAWKRRMLEGTSTPSWQGPVWHQKQKSQVLEEYLIPQGKICAGQTKTIEHIIFSPNGKIVLTNAEDLPLQLWETSTGQLWTQFSGHTSILASATFSSASSMLFTADWDRNTYIWDIARCQLLTRLQNRVDTITNAAFSPDGTRLLTGSWDKTARLWDVASGKLLTTFSSHLLGPINVAFSPDGTRLLTGSWDKTARLWDIASGKLLTTFSGHADAISSIAFSPDGTTVLTGSYDNTACIWEVNGARLRHRLQGHTDPITKVAFSPDGRTVLTDSHDYMPRLWDTQSGRCTALLQGHSISNTGKSFSPDSHTILTYENNGGVYLWQADGTDQGRLLSINHTTEKNAKSHWLNTIVDIHWTTDDHVLLVDKGGATFCPHFYHLHTKIFQDINEYYQ